MPILRHLLRSAWYCRLFFFFHFCISLKHSHVLEAGVCFFYFAFIFDIRETEREREAHIDRFTP